MDLLLFFLYGFKYLLLRPSGLKEQGFAQTTTYENMCTVSCIQYNPIFQNFKILISPQKQIYKQLIKVKVITVKQSFN